MSLIFKLEMKPHRGSACLDEPLLLTGTESRSDSDSDYEEQFAEESAQTKISQDHMDDGINDNNGFCFQFLDMCFCFTKRQPTTSNSNSSLSTGNDLKKDLRNDSSDILNKPLTSPSECTSTAEQQRRGSAKQKKKGKKKKKTSKPKTLLQKYARMKSVKEIAMAMLDDVNESGNGRRHLLLVIIPGCHPHKLQARNAGIGQLAIAERVSTVANKIKDHFTAHDLWHRLEDWESHIDHLIHTNEL